MGQITKFIALSTTGAGTWTVPNDWQSTGSIIRLIAGGGGGSRPATQTQARGGAAGGSYSELSNFSLTPGQTVYFSIGTGGTGATTNGGSGTAGGNTWINKTANSSPTVLANGGLAIGGTASTSGTGAIASTTGAIGNTVAYAGNGGTGGATSSSTGGGGGGGGSAGSSLGTGRNGGRGGDRGGPSFPFSGGSGGGGGGLGGAGAAGVWHAGAGCGDESGYGTG